jgi:hypothetical protein
MLFKTQVNAAIVLANQLSSRGLRLEAQPGTPLHQLVSTYMVQQADLIKPQEEGFKPIAALITSSANAFDAQLEGLPVPHTEKLEPLATDIANHVRSHLSFVKSVAVPLMRELAENYTAAASKYKFDAEGGVSIVSYGAPEILMDSNLRDMVEGHAKGTSGIEVPYIDLGVGSAAQVVEACVQALPGTGEVIRLWFAEKGDAFTNRVIDGCFSATPTQPQNFEVMRLGTDGLDVCLMVYLACNGLFDNPTDGVRQTLAQYNLALSQMRARAAVRLNYLMQEYDALLSTKTLVYSYNTAEIKVVGPVYKEFIQDGGSDAVLRVATRMVEPPRTLDQFAEKRDKIMAEQRKQSALISATIENQRYSILRDLLIEIAQTAVAQRFCDIYQDCPRGEVDTTWPNYVMFKTKLEEYLRYISSEDLKDSWRCASHIVQHCVFPHLGCVGKLMSGIDEASKVNPSLKVEEAALLATYGYVFDYVIDQITVRSIK